MLFRPSSVEIAVFVVGWASGWLALRGTRTFRSRAVARTTTVSVVIPARNEATTIGALVGSVVASMHDGDEVIVVDDGSRDATADRARAAGARVVRIDSVPAGWAGKPHACWHGAVVARGDVLVFVDADVSLARGVIDSLCSEAVANPAALVSVMPWHRTGSFVERASMLFNVVSSSVARTARGRTARHVAFGPLLATTRAAYHGSGGHRAASVRGAVIEDIALAGCYEHTMPFVGCRGEVEYRMYPLGWKQLLEGWTKNTALGGLAAPWVVTLLVVAWVTSLAGGWLTSPWFYLASVVQVAVMSRRVGNYRIVDAVVYPLYVAVFVAIVVRSVWRSVVIGRVTWRGRSITVR